MSEQNMITYVPKFLSDLGQPVSRYGLVSALFMGGAAVGDVIGGITADRCGKRPVAFVVFALASGPLFLFPHAATSAWTFLVVPLAGALIGAAHSIIIVRAQHIIPGGMAWASGLILGFMFSSGALGTYLSGYIADLFGFVPVFYLTGAVCLAAASLSLTMPE